MVYFCLKHPETYFYSLTYHGNWVFTYKHKQINRHRILSLYGWSSWPLPYPYRSCHRRVPPTAAMPSIEPGTCRQRQQLSYATCTTDYWAVHFNCPFYFSTTSKLYKNKSLSLPPPPPTPVRGSSKDPHSNYGSIGSIHVQFHSYQQMEGGWVRCLGWSV
jgi:hypothetical protein